ncbi:MAG: hypothetical protein ACKPKO_31565, partial [Candidatus Fonsibacter sp.]
MKKTHAAEIKTIIAERDDTVARLEADRQHFVKSLAETMNEVTLLRNRHNGFDKEEYADHDGPEDDDLRRWYDAAGDINYSAHGPLLPPAPPLVKPGPPPFCPDLVTAAHRAARVAAMEHSMNHKAYEKLNVPSCPMSGDMTNWIYTLGINTVCSGSFR